MGRRPRHTAWLAVLAVASLAATPSVAAADGGGGGSQYPRPRRESPLDPVQKALDGDDYAQAITLLEPLLEKDSDDPDAWNLMGYAQRNLGRFTEARAAYDKALALDPKHRGANEYLGELFLQTGDLAAAEAQLAILDDLCWLPCREERLLRDSIEAYREREERKQSESSTSDRS